MRTAMPSPRGTNRQKLFIDRRPAPSAAYDDANGLGDDGPSDKVVQGLLSLTSDALGDLFKWLEEHLEEADFETFAKALGKTEPEDRQPGFAQDHRRRARPMTSAQEADFAKRFPGAAKIGIL